MKNPLHYQLSEYDCGPTTILNAVSYLFEREELSPVLIRNIMLYCLDTCNQEGILGKNGTSRAAMMFMSNWLNGYGEVGQLTVSSVYLSGRHVWLGEESKINDALRRGGVVIARVSLDGEHYVLLTGITEKGILMFDPYYDPGYIEIMDYAKRGEIIPVDDQPFLYNRIVPEYFFNKQTQEVYALGPIESREAVIVFNDKTKETEEQTIEYYI